MSNSYDWGIVFAVLTYFADGMSSDALVQLLQTDYGWPRARAEAAIEEALKLGWVFVANGRLQAKTLNPEPSAPTDDGPGW